MAKKYFLASRAFMESVLRPYDLGTTQWYVLYLLAHDEPINQRELTRTLEIERATLSAVISALVRKGSLNKYPTPMISVRRCCSLRPLAGTYGRRFPILLG